MKLIINALGERFTILSLRNMSSMSNIVELFFMF